MRGRLRGIRRAAVELTPQAIEQLAQRVANLIGQQAGGSGVTAESVELVSASEVARRLGVTRAWVYEHAAELGARRLGSGPRARLRFDLATVLSSHVWSKPEQSMVSSEEDSAAAPPPRRRRRPTGRPAPGSVLVIRPRRGVC
jgi:hypothetical protein